MSIFSLLSKSIKCIYYDGFDAFLYRKKRKEAKNEPYDSWCKRLDENRLQEIASIVLQKNPKFSIVLVGDYASEMLISRTVKSIENQIYRNYEIIAAASEMSSLATANGDYIAIVHVGDTLAKHALLEMAIILNYSSTAKVLYTDEDIVDSKSGIRSNPCFKPDWSPDTLLSYNYIGHLYAFDKELLSVVHNLDIKNEYGLLLWLTDNLDNDEIVHIPRILYHSARTERSYITCNNFCDDIKIEIINRNKEDISIEYIQKLGYQRINYKPNSSHKVSIIIPSKDNPDILERCINSIREITSYSNYEIVIVDNGSMECNKKQYDRIANQYDCVYYYEKKDFNFSWMCNIGAKYSAGDYLLFLNDDIEIIEEQWLTRMLGQAEVAHTGAVGAKLLYPNSSVIQHVGVINILAGPVHVFGMHDDINIYYKGYNKVDINCLAVTAACLLVSRNKFYEVGQFDEDFKVGYNDVDLCFRLAEKGYHNIIRQDAILYHYESYTRGDDTIDVSKYIRLLEEQNRLYKKHPKFAFGPHMDPYYNMNCSQTDNDYSLNYNDPISIQKNGATIDIREYQEVTDIKYDIELNLQNEYGVYVKGWAYQLIRRNKKQDIKVAFINQEGKGYVFPTKKEYRPDLYQIIGKRKIALCGFSVMIDKSLVQDEYKMALLIDRSYIFIQ